MPYQTGTFTSPADLIATIKSFATSNGWSSSGDVVYKGTVFTELLVSGNYISVRGGTGQSAGVITGPSSKTVYCLGEKRLPPSWLTTTIFDYPGTFWLFMDTGPDSIVCIMRSNDGLYFNWLTFGMSVKYATYTGGEYFGASFSSNDTGHYPGMCSYGQGYGYSWYLETIAPLWWMPNDNFNVQSNFLIRSDLDAGVNWLGEDGWNTHPNGNAATSELFMRNPNNWTDQTILLPFYLSINRPSDLKSIIGLFPPARIARVINHEAGDLITLGADKYKVFPFFKKDTNYPDGHGLNNSLTGAGNSGTMGWAIKYDGP